MKRMRIVGLCLVAVFAFSAVAVASASAEPSGEFGKCVAKAGGAYSNSGCTLKSATGKYEWVPLTSPVTFTSKMKEATIATLETVKGTKVTCKKEHGTGEIANAHEVKNVISTFEECSSSGFPCESAGQAEGTIVTNALEGGTGVEKVGTTPPVNNKMAEELHAPAGQKVAAFSCAGLPIEVTGSILHPVTSNKMLTTATEKFSAAKGEQKPDKYAGGPADEHTLESNTAGGAFEEAGQTITAIVTFSEKVELNSTL